MSVQLGEVARFIRGVTFKPTDVLTQAQDDAVQVMRTKNVQGTLDQSDVIRIPKRLVKREDQLLRAGDTLISSANSWHLVGKCCWVPELQEPAAIGGFVTALRPTSDRVDDRYLYRWFSSPRIQATLRSFGNQTTNISNLNLKRCEALELPLPSLDEQRRIAAILDQADVLRAKRRQALAHLDDLTQSIFLDMLGAYSSRLERVEEIASVEKGSIRTGPFGSQLLHSEFVNEGIAVLGIDNVVTNQFRWSERRYITPEKYRQLKRYTVAPGDVLITIMGTCGRCVVVPEDIPTAINTKHLCAITVDRAKVLPEFVRACFLWHPSSRRFLLRRAKGSIMDGLNMGIIKEMPLPVPALELQNEFVTRAAAVHDHRLAASKSAEQLGSLVASLQAQAFSGNL